MTAPLSALAGSRVLVTGATGFTGSVVVRRLTAAGATVVAIARASSRRDDLRDLAIEWIEGDVFDRDVVDRAARGVHYVMHLAAAYRQAGRPDDYHRRVHVESTEHLARAAARQPSFARFVLVSTVGVHGHVAEGLADENAPFAPGDAYQATKAEAETWLRQYAPAAGLPFSIVRPCAIYGPGDTRLLKVFKMSSWGFFPILGGGRHLYHLIHVDDLAEILMLAATHPLAQGEAFIAGNDTPIGLERMVGVIGETVGRRVRFVRLPVGPFFALADLTEAVCRPLGLDPPIYRRRVAFFTKDRAFDTSKLRQRLGYVCRYGNEQGVADTARWYVDHGWIKGRRA